MLSPLATRPFISRRQRAVLVSDSRCLPIAASALDLQRMVRSNIASIDAMSRAKAATEQIELYLNRVLVAKTFDLFLDALPGTDNRSPFNDSYDFFSSYSREAIDLIRPPLISVQGVYTVDATGRETLVDPATYFVGNSREPGRLQLASGYTWQSYGRFESIRIRIVAGHVTPFRVNPDGTLAAQGHGLYPGLVVRVSRGLNQQVPAPLDDSTDYTVTSVSDSGLSLLDESGQLVSVQPAANDWSFLGTPTSIGSGIPEAILREIAYLAVYGDEQPEAPSNTGQKQLRSANTETLRPVHVGSASEKRLAPFRILSI